MIYLGNRLEAYRVLEWKALHILIQYLQQKSLLDRRVELEAAPHYPVIDIREAVREVVDGK